MEAFELAPEGAEYVVDERFRRPATGPEGWRSTNLRTTFRKIVRRSGRDPWPRLCHNLRATRETELVEAYPVQVVTSRLGNTPNIAMRHHLMTTGEHFDRAVRGDGTAGQAAQDPAQQMHANKRKTAHGEKREIQNLAFYAEKQQGALSCASPQTGRTERVGFEPTVRLPAHRFSKPAPSATRTPLHVAGRQRDRAKDNRQGAARQVWDEGPRP